MKNILTIKLRYFHIHLVEYEVSVLENKFYYTQLEGLKKGKWSKLSMKELFSGDVSDLAYQTQFETFFQALYQNKVIPETSLNVALHTYEVIFTADHSSSLLA